MIAKAFQVMGRPAGLLSVAAVGVTIGPVFAGDDPIEVEATPSGSGTIETYTVIYNRDQTPARGVIYGRTAAGRRFVANTPHEETAYAGLTGENRVGEAVTLETDDAGHSVARLAG